MPREIKLDAVSDFVQNYLLLNVKLDANEIMHTYQKYTRDKISEEIKKVEKKFEKKSLDFK